MSIKSKVKFSFFVFTSIVIALILGYIHEGYHVSDWMSHFNDWLQLIFYSIIIFIGQVIFAKILLKNYHGILKVLLSAIGGAAIGIFILVTLIFT
ncbi:hypothetical protein ACUNWD_17590 [Sunxiuqinia sp. A32]|uniref:hypothetical protein n=1 Tax=Sunxiuqinia sp. A32 TaxID=3461496 RepID=UPI004046389C